MKGLALWVAVLAVALSATPTMARAGHSRSVHCCLVRAGTPIVVALAEPVSTKLQKTGDQFDLQLAEPVVVDGRVVIAAGTQGIGEVVEATKPGVGGRPAKLVLAARFLQLGARQVPLQGLQLAGAGRNNAIAAQAAGAGGMAFFPLGFVGLAVSGGNVDFRAGARATAAIGEDVVLRPLGRASNQEIYDAAALADADVTGGMGGAIDIPPPPPGMGQVVFFRPYSVLGIGQWFGVREHGNRIGKLFNGAYFVQIVEPGLHSYTAAFEPELGDRLTLEVAPGLTYFVQGALTKGVVVGAANLLPSTRAAFEKKARSLKESVQPPGDADQAPAASDAPPDSGASPPSAERSP
jgi:hypothetical protein